jgi:hypothetical protein
MVGLRDLASRAHRGSRPHRRYSVHADLTTPATYGFGVTARGCSGATTETTLGSDVNEEPPGSA